MRYDILKGTDDKISMIALGTDVYGTDLPADIAVELLDTYCELGGNVIDTASVYGGEAENVSEKLIGKWISEKKNRDKIFISTKGGHPKVKTMNIPRLSDAEIKHDMDLSLKNLGVDYVDIYWLHRDDERLSVEPIMNTLSDLVKSGKTRYIGMSNWTHTRIDEANRYARANKLPMIISSQIQYSVAKAVVENNDPTLVLMNDCEYEFFKNNNLSVFAFASQAKGFFSKITAGGIENLSPKAKTRYYSEENMKIYDNIRSVADTNGISVGEAVIAALVNNTHFQTVPIIGCKNTVQLKESLNGVDVKLSQKECDFIALRG